MKKVIIESPYAGQVERNIAYARMCVKDSLIRGESPIASHLLHTQEGILNDNNEVERGVGILAGLAWLKVADLQVFYIDYGYSAGMNYAKKIGELRGVKMEERRLF